MGKGWGVGDGSILLMLLAGGGGLIGALSWSVDATPGYALLMLFLLSFAASRWSAAVLFAAYFIGGAALPLWTALGSRSDAILTPGAILTISCWLGALVAPWVLWPGSGASLAARWAGALGSLVASIVPPFGVMSAMHPAHGLGWVAPSSGAVGLALLVLAWLAVLARPPVQRATLLLVAALIIALLPVPRPLEVAQAIEAFSSRVPADDAASWDADLLRLAVAEKAIQERPHVASAFIWPEWHLDRYNHERNAAVAALLRPALRNRVAVVGAVVELQGERRNGAVIVDELQVRFVSQRQPLPFAMWKPGWPGHFAAHWGEDPIVSLAERRALLIFCSEELAPMWVWWPLALDRPDDLVVMASHRWTVNDGIEAFTARHSESSALLFGVPLTRAIHRGESAAR